MKAAKIRNNKKNKEIKVVEEEYSLKKMLIIVLVLVVTFVIFYLITTIIVKPTDENNSTNSITEIDSSKILLNQLLDRKEEEYYVLATKESLYVSESSYSDIYDMYINDYSTNEDALSFYRIDLDDALNKNYISEELNISDNLEDLKINNEVLFKIKDGKIKKYYIGNSEIVEFLSELKES